jgi:hypothetical protein
VRPFTAIAAAIFALMAIAHVYRLATGFSISVAGTEVGQGVSWVALIVTAALAYGLYREAKS